MEAADLDAQWTRCAPWLQAALDRSPPTHTLDDVKVEIRCGNAKLWYGRNSAAVTQIETYPRCRALNVWLAGGDLAELRDDMLPNVETFARETGCQFVAISGREGWVRALPDYAPLHRTCAKELT